MRPTAGLAQGLRDASRMVARVAAGRSLADEFERRAEGSSETPRSVLIDLTHGTLRRYGRVQAIVQELSRRGRPDTLVESLLWCSLYALESGRYAEYTVVDQAVRACTLLERWSAKGYVNALLRRFIRERSALESRLRAEPQARFQHPQWWIEALRAAYPREWEAVLAAGNSHPPMCLRVNRRRVPAAEYQALLAAAGQVSRRVGEEALLLERPLPVDRLPGFDAGDVSVQDLGAQRAAHCLDLAAGQRVLDACAAPGGKAAHILELADVALTALDADAARSRRIQLTLERLGLSATIRTADCTRLAEWWDGAPFDRILADVPCSASGVARRHPDLKWLRRAADVAAFAERQGAILDTLWQALAPGGKLLYATCSVFPQENDAVIDAFVARAPGARRLALPDGSPAQRLPDAQHDGFYYALTQKPA
ncbi:MAG TPA: 16S rRNA (cytosine(967)-C(5))-methyltransferase RsmB [Burkholderiales bacterium]|nr:16S rRNA (cytosine(967)-C(5))-methyltransferase RsmB [Burkholderiales bacterium]